MKELITEFERNFRELHEKSRSIIERTPEEKLFLKPKETYRIFSVGEFVLRSAGKIEQTFGGITSRLWDDPFEWTLPEELSTRKKIFEYLDEVEATRLRGFEFFKADEDLKSEIPAPEDLKSLFRILLETSAEAARLQAKAELVLCFIEV